MKSKYLFQAAIKTQGDFLTHINGAFSTHVHNTISQLNNIVRKFKHTKHIILSLLENLR